MNRESEFRRLYDAHRGAVYAYLAGRTVSRESAADLLQDVFLRVWRHLDAVAGMPSERQRAWIFTVARNLSVDAYRATETEAGTERALAREPAVVPAPASAPVIAAERMAVVTEAIKRLPEQQRVTLTMAAVGGLNSQQIAAALGVPAGTVRYRLSLARRALAEALDGYDDSAEE